MRPDLHQTSFAKRNFRNSIPFHCFDKTPWRLLAALIALWWISVWPCLGWGFFQDDIMMHFHHALKGMKWHHSFWRDSGMGYLRTFMQLVFHLGREVFGARPWLWTLTASALHLGAAMSVWLFGARWLKSTLAGWAAAALFCLHFAHWDVHFWPGAINDTVMILGFCIALWGHCVWMESGRFHFALVSLGGVVVSAMGKEQAILIAPAIGLIEAAHWIEQGRKEPLRRIAMRMIPAAAACAEVLALTLSVQRGNPGALSSTGDFRVWGVQTVDQWLAYIGAQAWPYFRLAHLPDLAFTQDQVHWWRPPAVLAIPRPPYKAEALGDAVTQFALEGVLVFLLWKKQWRGLMLFLWMLAMALPSAAVQTGLATRYAYPLSPAAMLLAVWLFRMAWAGFPRARRPIALGFAGMIILFVLSAWESPSRLPMKWESRLTAELIRQAPPILAQYQHGDYILLRDYPINTSRRFYWLHAEAVFCMAGSGREIGLLFRKSGEPAPHVNGRVWEWRWDDNCGQWTQIPSRNSP